MSAAQALAIGVVLLGICVFVLACMVVDLYRKRGD